MHTNISFFVVTYSVDWCGGNTGHKRNTKLLLRKLPGMIKRKVFVYILRIIASLFLLVAMLLCLAVRLSDKGDVVDRNSGWIVLLFFITSGLFIYSLLMSDGSPKHIHRKKAADELLKEIRRPDRKN